MPLAKGMWPWPGQLFILRAISRELFTLYPLYPDGSAMSGPCLRVQSSSWSDAVQHLSFRLNRQGCQSWLCHLLAERPWVSQPPGASFSPSVKWGCGQEGLHRAGMGSKWGAASEAAAQGLAVLWEVVVMPEVEPDITPNANCGPCVCWGRGVGAGIGGDCCRETRSSV